MYKIKAVHESKEKDQIYFDRGQGGYLPFTASHWTPADFGSKEFEGNLYPEIVHELPEDAVDVSDQYQHVIDSGNA